MIIFNVANDLICKISCLLLHSLQRHRRILPHWNSAVLQYWHILSKIILIQQGMPLKFKFPEIFQSVAFFSFQSNFPISAQNICPGNTNSPFPTGCCRAAGILPCISTGILLQGVLGKRETFCACCDKYCEYIYIHQCISIYAVSCIPRGYWFVN